MDIKINNKNIILRVDFNVPIEEGIIQNSKRIDSVIPTIKLLLEKNVNRIVIISHLGRPKGKYNKKLSLLPVYNYLKKIFPRENVNFIEYTENYVDFFSYVVCNNPKNIYLLDNIRFFREEEDNDPTFCEYLSKLGDVYINDAFGTMHRNHSSITGINVPIKIPGLLVKKELEMFNLVLNNQKKEKVCAIIGGSKVSDKIGILVNLISKVDYLIIGGGMAFTFLKVLKNSEIGNSLFDENGCENVLDIVNKCKELNVELCLPTDFVINNQFKDVGDIKIVDENIPPGYMGLDIGPKSVSKFGKIIDKVDVVIWNGPMGVFEMEPFSKGSTGLLKKLGNKECKGCKIIIGGGDTAYLCEKYNCTNKITHISTGGGASLKLLEGKTLHGLNFLQNIP